MGGTTQSQSWSYVKPAQAQAAQEVKKTYVTNYVRGQQADLSLPTIATGGIAPQVLGRDIVKSPDMIWYGNLQPIYEVKSEQATVTDPTTGAQTITTTITTSITGYTIDIQFCAGVGPGVRLRSILLDNATIWSGTVGPARTDFVVPDSLIIKNVTFAGGNFDQAVDPYLQSKIPQAISGYRGVAYVILKGLDVTKLGNLSFEVDRYPDPLGITTKNKIGDDLNAVSAIAEIITKKWGGAGQDISKIGSTFIDVANAAFDFGNGCSIVSRTINSANDLNTILLDQLDATLWEDHELGTIEITAYDKNFDRENALRIFDKDITKMDQLQKPGWSGIPTSLSLTYVDRAQNYGDIPIATRNLATSAKIAKSIKSMSFPAVRVGSLAAKILAREGASSGSPVQQVTMTVNRKAADVHPGQIVLVTYEHYGYYSLPMIVTKRRTQPVEDNSVTLTGNIILYPNNTVLFAAPEASFFVPVDPNPHAPTDVKIMSAPWALRSVRVPSNYPISGGGTKVDYNWNIVSDMVMLFGNPYNDSQQKMRARFHDTVTNNDILIETNALTSSPDPSTNLSAPTDDFVYPAFAKLATAIDKYDNWDDSSDTQTMVLKNIGPGPGMTAALNNFNKGGFIIVLVDDEIFTIGKDVHSTIVYNDGLRTATFTGVRRALADTVAQNHAVNADVIIMWVLYNDTARYSFTTGATIDFKFSGLASPKGLETESPLGSPFLASYTMTDRANRPLRPHNTKINGSRGTSTPTALALGATPTISWSKRGRSIQNTFTLKRDLPWQSDPADVFTEVLAGVYPVYRVWITDSANVDWDCGVTADTAAAASLVATIPLGAAVGNGFLWVDAEFDAGAGVKVSKFKDKLPIVLS